MVSETADSMIKIRRLKLFVFDEKMYWKVSGVADPEFENGFSKKQNGGYKMADIFLKNHDISVKVGVYNIGFLLSSAADSFSNSSDCDSTIFERILGGYICPIKQNRTNQFFWPNMVETPLKSLEKNWDENSSFYCWWN